MATVVRCDRKGCTNEDVLEPGQETMNGSRTVRRVGVETKGWESRSAEADLCQPCREELSNVFFEGKALDPVREKPTEFKIAATPQT